MTSDRLYVVHIAECIERIEQFTATGHDHFFDDVMTQDAILRNLHILSESSTRVSTEFMSRFPDVPWREMRAFRNVVVHDYLGLDLKQVWDIVVNDLPQLKAAIMRMLQSFEGT